MSKRSLRPTPVSDSVGPCSASNIGGPPAWAAAIVLAVAIGAIYGPALNVPFIFDDTAAILDNPSITSIWPLVGTADRGGPLNAPRNSPLAGRPVVNFSFALNYYFGELNPFGYHLVNVALHLLSAVLVWNIVRRTLQLEYFDGRFATSAAWLALAVALLWALHPLLTEAVIYATQRTELMFAFFYLATLYCSLRYWAADVDGGQRAVWLTLAVFASLAGMASKEVMVSAPLIILLFERTFISGTLANAMRRSWPLYVGLASTWLLLFALNIHAPRSESAGFGLGVSLADWWLTQAKVFWMYLKLVVWPWPLFIHYQIPYLTHLAEAWMYLVPVVLLGIATLALLWHNHPLGFLLTCVLFMLAPTSIVPIVTEMAAERRMYLPLVAIVAVFIVGGYLLLIATTRRERAGPRWASGSTSAMWATVLLSILIATSFGLVSAKRLDAYSDQIGLWRDIVRAQPHNHLAHNNLGYYLTLANEFPEAIAELRIAIAIKPDYPSAFKTLGIALLHSSQYPEAVESLQAALALKPDDPEALNNLSSALMHLGRVPEAIETLHRVLRTHPENAQAHNNLGRALTRTGQLPEAIKELEDALALTPDDPVVLNNLGIALTQAGRTSEAVDQLQRAVQIKPDYADAHSSLAIALFQGGNVSEAIEQFQQAVKLNPQNAAAHSNLASALSQTGNMADATVHFEQAVRLEPARPDLHHYLADTLRQTGRYVEAVEHYQHGLRLNPQLVAVYPGQAQALAAINRSQEAITTAEKGIEVARSLGQEPTAAQLEEWLEHYRREIQRAADAATPDEPPAE